MKNNIWLLFTMAFVMVSATLHAEEAVPLGAGNIAVKVDRLNFTDSDLKPSDEGTYVGLEGYMNVAKNIYTGLEVGFLNPCDYMDIIKQELTFVPVELNAKYISSITPCLIMDGGMGISYNYCELKLSDYTGSSSNSDWVLGGQVFADLNYTIDQFFMGLNAKYQWTEAATDLAGINFAGSIKFTNWRIGGQVGIKF
jgi:hypothetical protein